MLFADAFPPAILDLFPARWVPTLQYSVYVRARPETGWIQASLRTRSMVDGLLEEDGELYDGAGRLVAQSRQLALLLPPA
jgi:acyl-CoA thioesterase